MQIQGPRQLSGTPRAVSESIRQSKLGRYVDDRSNRAARAHLYQLDMRWKGWRSCLN